MRARSWILLAGLMFAATPAMADIEWSGPGYYIEDLGNALWGGFIGGPYSSQSDCQNAIASLAPDEENNAGCTYYSSDPDQSQN